LTGFFYDGPNCPERSNYRHVVLLNYLNLVNGEFCKSDHNDGCFP
jgi:hypothetical protein